MSLWVVTSWYAPEFPLTLPPGVGTIRVVNSETLWVNGKIANAPRGTWLWAMTPSIARKYTSEIKHANHLLAAQGGHPARLGRRRSIPLMKNIRWCRYLVRRVTRLLASETSRASS